MKTGTGEKTTKKSSCSTHLLSVFPIPPSPFFNTSKGFMPLVGISIAGSAQRSARAMSVLWRQYRDGRSMMPMDEKSRREDLVIGTIATGAKAFDGKPLWRKFSAQAFLVLRDKI